METTLSIDALVRSARRGEVVEAGDRRTVVRMDEVPLDVRNALVRAMIEASVDDRLTAALQATLNGTGTAEVGLQVRVKW